MAERIVVGVDGSEPSYEALRWALRQARHTAAGSPVHAVYTYAPQPHVGRLAVEFPPLHGNPAQRNAKHTVDRLVKRAADEGFGDVPLEVELAVGDPGERLVAAAIDAQLLVVGSRGRGSVAGVLLGSVGRYCVTHARCPVVVVR